MKGFFKHISLLVMGASLLSGCAVGPNFLRPWVNTPENFRSAPTIAESASFANLPWWQVFRDERLQNLIQQALANNYDLRIAVSRVEQARQIAAQARAQYFPQVNYDGSIGSGKNALFGTIAPNSGKTQDSAFVDLSVFWEVDLWGRIRRLNEAARAQFLATEEAQRGVTISLVSSVAQAYFELLELDLQLEIARRNTQSFADTLQIFTVRLEQGVASKLETASAEGLLTATASNIPELERQIVLRKTRSTCCSGATRLPSNAPRGCWMRPCPWTSRRVCRRPCSNVARTSARRKKTCGPPTHRWASPWPTSSRGSVSRRCLARRARSLRFHFGNHQSLAVAGNLTGPIFQGGALVAQYRQAKAVWEEARLRYEQTVLNAFQEVSNALISRQKYQEVQVQQARSVKAYEEAVEVSIKRYVAGKASYYEVLQNQQNLFPAETILAQTELNRLLVVVQLYKAWVAGGPLWKECPLSHKIWSHLSVEERIF